MRSRCLWRPFWNDVDWAESFFVAMVRGKTQDSRWALAAVVVGGALGLVSEVTQVTMVSYAAILLSIVISIIALRQGKQN